ncbi:hypothetical protein ABFW14_25450 [Mycolicibacterium fortuitum]|uniref:hypothetical protein n=1 Tax=Mycolicibacterium TaxID=1866885 RepID=UPI00244E381B|nr:MULTISPECIES: hypothetical protein [Mycolicibacterium]
MVAIHAENLGVAQSAIGRGFGADFHEHLEPALDDESFAILEQTQRFLLDRQLIDRAVDLQQWAAPDFLANSIKRLTTTGA